MCGKDKIKVFLHLVVPESPPHVRERRDDNEAAVCPDGITPACAGKTKSTMIWDRTQRDHPRMCGKDFSLRTPLPSSGGSPPHVRERLALRHANVVRLGITPACAGKTPMWTTQCNGIQDHPRMCGKDSLFCYRPITMWGSPPHVRERHIICVVDNLPVGITPACAGKTCRSPRPGPDCQDHPRMCGKDSRGHG